MTEDEHLNAALKALREETRSEPSAALRAAVLAAAPKPRRLALQGPAAALAACAVFGLATGFAAAQWAPMGEDAALLDAVIADSLAEGGFDG